jgi:hypothetical protein
MKCGDIIFVRGKGILPSLIKHFDHGEFSHCCIALSENVILEAQYNTKSIITPFTYDDYEIVSLELTEEQRRKVLELGVDLVGHNYDYLEIWSIFLREVWNKKLKINNSPKNYICSELVEVLLSEVGVIPQDKNLRDMTPNELFTYLKSVTLK